MSSAELGPAPPEPSTPAPSGRLDRWLWLLFPLLSLALLFPVVLGGEVLLPARYLLGFSPWGDGLSPEQRQLLPQWNVLQWDGMAEFYPWRLHLARELAAGRLPLWNPYVLCGTPFLANSQSAPLYPLHWLYALPFGPSTAVRMGWLAWLHLSLAGSFAWLLARWLGARPLAACVAGAAYELSGFAVAWLELPSFLTVACWIPLVVLSVARAVRERSTGWTVLGGAAAGLMLLGGHLQIAFYGLLAALLAWVVEAWEQRAEGARGLAVSARIGLGVVGLGLALAAPQVLSSLDLSRISHRAGAPSEAGYQGYAGYALPASNWITLLVPDYYGLPGNGDFWGQWKYGAPNVMEYAGHVGTAAVLLALVALLGARRRGLRIGLPVALGVLSLLLATGTPVARLLYFGVPGFGQTGSPARVLVLFCLAQALLAGLGAEALLRTAGERWDAAARRSAVALALFLVLVGALLALAGASLPVDAAAAGRYLSQISYPAAVRAVAWAGITVAGIALMAWLLRDNPLPQREATLGGTLIVLVAGGLLWLGAPYNLTAPESLSYPPTPPTTALQAVGGRVATLNRAWGILDQPPATLPPNASIAYGWRDAQGYDSLYLGTYRRLADAVAAPERQSSPEANGNIVFIKHVASPLYRLLGARYVASRQPLDLPALVPAAGSPGGPPFLYEYRDALPEAYAVTAWTHAEDAGALERLRSLPAEDLARTAVLAPGPELGGSAGASAPVPFTLERLAPGHLRAKGRLDQPGLLVVLETWAPGWRATVDSGSGPRPDRVRRANVAFQAVRVPAGEVTVELRYQPGPLRAGLFLGLVAVAVLIAGALALGPRSHPGCRSGH